MSSFTNANAELSARQIYAKSKNNEKKMLKNARKENAIRSLVGIVYLAMTLILIMGFSLLFDIWDISFIPLPGKILYVIIVIGCIFGIFYLHRIRKVKPFCSIYLIEKGESEQEAYQILSKDKHYGRFPEGKAQFRNNYNCDLYKGREMSISSSDDKNYLYSVEVNKRIESGRYSEDHIFAGYIPKECLPAIKIWDKWHYWYTWDIVEERYKVGEEEKTGLFFKLNLK